MASELASSKWLLPQIDLHRWEEVFQVGTGITPRDRKDRGGPGKEAQRSLSTAPPWGAGEELQAVGLKLTTKPTVSMALKLCPCQPIAHAPLSQPCPATQVNTEKILRMVQVAPGLDEGLETEKREGLPSKAIHCRAWDLESQRCGYLQRLWQWKGSGTCQNLRPQTRHKPACRFVCLRTSGARVVTHVEAPSTGVTVATENKA